MAAPPPWLEENDCVLRGNCYIAAAGALGAGVAGRVGGWWGLEAVDCWWNSAVCGDEAILRDLVEKGWSVQPNFFDPGLIESLLAEAVDLDRAEGFRRAGIGRGEDFTVEADVRRDKVRWLSFDTPIQRRYRAVMELLRLEINRCLFLGLFEFECHFALYEAGAFYRRHMDSFRGAANRIVTTVTYLNPGWEACDGGFLTLCNSETGEAEVRVKPQAGTLVVFLSEEMLHEVEVCHRARVSIAGWFRCNSSVGRIVDPIR